MSKIQPISSSQSSSHDFDHKRKRREDKERNRNQPAVVNHIITGQERREMKQLALPFDEDIAEIKIYELYTYTTPGSRMYRTYGKHIDYTMAKDINQAEELFNASYPEWWKSMGVKEVDVIEVQNKLKQLEQQVDTCKFVLEAFSIV